MSSPSLSQTSGHESSEEAHNRAAYWEQRLAATPTLAGVGHNGFGLSYNRWMYELRRRVFLRHVGALPIDFQRAEVLDVGSGTGFWLRAWKSLGVRVLTGSDITSASASKIRAELPSVTAVQIDITSPSAIEVLGGGYDAISAIDMLYHILSDQGYARAISNLSQLLKAGGYLVITENLLRFKNSSLVNQTSRTLDFTMGLLAKNGFTVLQRAPVFVLMNNPVDMRSEIPDRIWHFLMRPAAHSEIVGAIVGAFLIPLDLLLTKLLREGPSTEILICRKDSAGAVDCPQELEFEE